MKSERHIVVSCLVILSLCMVVGCGKKPTEEKPQGATTPQTQGTQAAATQPAPTQAAPTAPALVTQFQGVDIDLQKPIAEIQTAVQNMSVDTLKAAALKYTETIVSKQADAEALLAKVKGLSISDALGEEGKTLKNDLQSLQTTVSELKDRYQVYYNALKEKGADLTGLALSK